MTTTNWRRRQQNNKIKLVRRRRPPVVRARGKHLCFTFFSNFPPFDDLYLTLLRCCRRAREQNTVMSVRARARTVDVAAASYSEVRSSTNRGMAQYGLITTHHIYQ